MPNVAAAWLNSLKGMREGARASCAGHVSTSTGNLLSARSENGLVGLQSKQTKQANGRTSEVGTWRRLRAVGSLTAEPGIWVVCRLTCHASLACVLVGVLAADEMPAMIAVPRHMDT